MGIGGLVLHPTSTYVSDSGPAPDGVNNGSVVIRIVYQGTSILLTGDIEHETDGDLMRWDHRLRSDILKAGAPRLTNFLNARVSRECQSQRCGHIVRKKQ